jgi:hypothetical protein
MKKWLMLLVALFCLYSVQYAANSSIHTSVPGSDGGAVTRFDSALTTLPAIDLATIRIKEIEKLTGTRFTLKERVAWKIFQYKLRREAKHRSAEEDNDKKGRTAQLLGILSLVAIFIPILNIASIGLAIAAIIVGSNARKINPNDRRAKTGVTLGIITLAIIIAALILLVVLLSTGGFAFF